MRAMVLPLVLLLPTLMLTPATAAPLPCIFVPHAFIAACVDPAGQSCVDLREGIEGCAGSGSTWVSDAPPEEYHCEDVYTMPNCCPYYPQGCGAETQLFCYDQVLGPFWRVGTDGSYVTIWVSHFCYFQGCPSFPYTCGVYDRLMYRVPFQTVEA